MAHQLVRKYRWPLLSGWLLLVLASLPFAARESDHLTSGGFSVPGSQSAYVDSTLARHFPGAERDSLVVLLSPQRGATAEEITAKVWDLEGALLGLKGLILIKQAREQAVFAAGLIGPIAIPLQVTTSKQQARDEIQKLKHRLSQQHKERRVRVALLGQGILGAALQELTKQQLRRAEAISFPILCVVLLTIFGSLWAAALPLILAFVAVSVTGALIYFLSLTLELSALTVNAASMLGIGVAVDYSLIVIHRFRQELQRGRTATDALQITYLTSGKAVVYSGITVVAALMGVWVVPIAALRSMALGVVIVVSLSVIVCITLLPILISILGARRLSPGPLMQRYSLGWNRSAYAAKMSWERWTNMVLRNAPLTAVLISIVLLVLCLPLLHMHVGTGAVAQLDSGNKTRLAFNEAAKTSGPGVVEPAFIVVYANKPGSSHYLTHAVSDLRSISGHFSLVKELGPTRLSADGRYATFTATLTVDPESSAAERLVRDLRTSLASSSYASDVKVTLGGASARQADEVRSVATGMWKILIAVLALSFVPIMFLLRSVVLPIKAVIMNLLSVGAAYGALVIVFQWGWFDGILHYHSPGHIDALVPPLLLAVVFGLSTDYEVFLLSRVRESWLNHGDVRRAVADGLAKSARTISNAAFIIVCVFAVFVGTGVPTIKELGFGASFAIAIDATLVRLALAPAAMVLLGNLNWWLPKRLGRILSVRPSGEPTRV
jgi:uncharacterized membrane protein YdfJ with MMPL/SSD domain